MVPNIILSRPEQDAPTTAFPLSQRIASVDYYFADIDNHTERPKHRASGQRHLIYLPRVLQEMPPHLGLPLPALDCLSGEAIQDVCEGVCHYHPLSPSGITCWVPPEDPGCCRIADACAQANECEHGRLAQRNVFATYH